ncbi:uncharacterized protein LOC133329509, partial [Musca vetustissima]|uniref:uncharacterized protein LOC133329509 n=1 Tax=Musca vetustissima TaxID=27455 RepID=UPI002AB74048
MAIQEDVATKPKYYTPQIYPFFELKVNNFTGSTHMIFYLDHVKNMHKSPLRLTLKIGSNKSYILKEQNGTFFLGGHVGHFFDEFAKYHNATITFPIGYIDAFRFDEFLDNNTLDMSQQLELNNYKSGRVHSDNYAFLDWCIMVPTESPIPDYMFYAMIFDVRILSLILMTMLCLTLAIDFTFWLEGKPNSLWNIFLNIYTFNGMLGQPFQMEATYCGWRSILYVLTCLGGVMINTTFVTYLQSFNASPPTLNPINTLEDVMAHNKKILMYADEFYRMDNVTFPDLDLYVKVITVVPTFYEFYTLRDNFDTRYLYPVPEVQWALYDEQQKFFAKRKFRLSDVCFVRMHGQMIPMQENSPFEEAVNDMIGIANQAGLIKHWKQMSFIEAIQRKRINLTDSSRKM